jgi:hypothetical protein
MKDLLTGKKSALLKYLAETDGLKEYERDSPSWWMAWETYIQHSHRISSSDPVSRIKWFRDNIGFRFGDLGFVGRGGHDSVIIAYDALLRTVHVGGGWEKLLYLAVLHSGDSDSTGCIAGAWYGAMFGIGEVPTNMLAHLEYREDLEIISGSLFTLSNELHA